MLAYSSSFGDLYCCLLVTINTIIHTTWSPPPASPYLSVYRSISPCNKTNLFVPFPGRGLANCRNDTDERSIIEYYGVFNNTSQGWGERLPMQHVISF